MAYTHVSLPRATASFDSAGGRYATLDRGASFDKYGAYPSAFDTGSAVFSARGVLDGTMQSVMPVIDASGGMDGSVQSVRSVRPWPDLPMAPVSSAKKSSIPMIDAAPAAKYHPLASDRVHRDLSTSTSPPEGPIFMSSTQFADSSRFSQRSPSPVPLGAPAPSLPARPTPFDSGVAPTSAVDCGGYGDGRSTWTVMQPQGSVAQPTPFDSRPAMVAQHSMAPQPSPFDSQPATMMQPPSIPRASPFDSRRSPVTILGGDLSVVEPTPLDGRAPDLGGMALMDMPLAMPDRPDVGSLERRLDAWSEEYLDERLRGMERVAKLAAMAVGAPTDSATPWRPGGRDFREAFVSQPLAGFYVDKSRIALREAYLASTTYHTRDQDFIDWLACISSERQEKRRQMLQQHAWRNAFPLEEEDDSEEEEY